VRLNAASRATAGAQFNAATVAAVRVAAERAVATVKAIAARGVLKGAAVLHADNNFAA